MIDNNIFISSATLIPDMYNDYNIQSDDFVSRFPIWIANALEELKFIQAYVDIEKDIEFDDHRCQLPWDFRGVIDVIINNKKAVFKNSAEFNKDTITEKVTTVPTYTPYPGIPNADITSPGDKNDSFNHAPVNKEQPYYYISNNWIHTNVDYGTIHLRYRALPVVYDSIINMDVPLIYNNGPLKKYLKLYVLKQMLLRGYKHPVVSLTANNPYTNPAIELDRMRIQVRVSCNKFSNDRRENIATILRTLE